MRCRSYRNSARPPFTPLGSARIVSFILLAVHAAMAWAGPEPNPRLTAACDGEHVQVTLGLPYQYRTAAASASGKERSGAQFCISTATGNPYELLSWLENGSLQAVVLPEFAVAVLRADQPDFDREYVEFEASPVALLQLERRELVLRDDLGRSVDLQGLAAAFAKLAAADALAELVLPHHLSSAVPALFTSATRWADTEQLSADARDRFMVRLIAAMRFGQPTASGSLTFTVREALSDGQAREQEVVTERDLLVIRRQLLINLQRRLGAQWQVAPSASRPPREALFAATAAEEARMGAAVAAFRDANYRSQADGSIARRYFRFSIDELWEIFAARDAQDGTGEQDRSGLALVLTGGGVKAAYQTRLVDALYASDREMGPRLRNGESSTAKTQKVDYVIGTSGGALLGMFVGALNDSLLGKPQWSGLTDLLWRPGGGELKSWNVFPLLDMLRYFSVIACFWTLWIVMTIALRWFGDRWLTHVRIGSPQHAAIEMQKQGLNIVRWKSESWAWLLLLGTAPIVVVYICNRQGLEHVPPVAGIYYTLMAVIAWYADIALTPKKRLSWREIRLPKTFLILVAIGIACIAIPAGGDWVVERCKAIPWQVNLCFAGFLLLAFAFFAFFSHQHEHFEREPARFGLGMLGGILAMVFASYAVLWIGVMFGYAAFLELTGAFWLWLLPAMLVLSVLLLVAGHVAPGQRPSTPPQRAVGYMFGEHNSRAFWSGHRRYTRFVMLATVSWCWWNLWAAPGMYGNCPANEYFTQTYETFAGAIVPGAKEFALTTPYVVTATSLEKGQERYFLFADERAAHDPLDDRAWFNVASDGRWITVRKFNGAELRAAAFASGSPFPVFSSHQVALADLGLREHLIDGGFAHNKPLDAARALGARKVLVLNSSPLQPAAAGGPCAVAAWLRVGELACNVPKLLPYLWSRSQVEDSLSSANMLVASVYPVGDGAAWPLLTDFRGAVVERMIAAAERDLHARIGTIESWGAPHLSDAYLLTVSLSAIERAMQR